MNNFEAIPSFIKDNQLFCVWRWEKDKNGRSTKVPYDPNRHDATTRAASNDPTTFAGFDIALDFFNTYQFDGLGVCMSGDLVGIDVDHCYNSVTGELSEPALSIVDALDSYTEVSPSGDGIHILLNAPRFIRQNGSAYKGRYYINRRDLGLEVYPSGITNKYLTITGDMWQEGDARDRSDELEAILNAYMTKPRPAAIESAPANPTDVDDARIIELARNAKNGATWTKLWDGDITGYHSHSEADQALCNMLAFWTGRDAERIDRMFRQSGLYREKWEREDYRTATIGKAIEGCRDTYTPPRATPTYDYPPYDDADNLAEEPEVREPQKTPLDMFDDFLGRIKGEAYRPFKTGMGAFDEFLGGGILKQSLVVIMAPPAVGKTVFVSQIMEGIARSGQDVIYLNLEMSREYMYARSLSRLIGEWGQTVAAGTILQGYSWSKEQKRLVEDAAAIYRREIAPHITYNPDDCDGILENIEALLNRYGREAQRQGKMAPPIAIDYLHLISTLGSADSTELIKQAISVIKGYTINYDTFAIAISATNRTSNKRGRQSQSSGRDSSSIEYTADVLLSLNYRHFDEGLEIDHNVKADPDNPNHLHRLEAMTPRKMVMHMHKNRMGASSQKLYLDFFANQSRYEVSRASDDGPQAPAIAIDGLVEVYEL